MATLERRLLVLLEDGLAELFTLVGDNRRRVLRVDIALVLWRGLFADALGADEPGISAVGGEEVGVRARLEDLAGADDVDVSVANRAQTMGFTRSATSILGRGKSERETYRS